MASTLFFQGDGGGHFDRQTWSLQGHGSGPVLKGQVPILVVKMRRWLKVPLSHERFLGPLLSAGGKCRDPQAEGVGGAPAVAGQESPAGGSRQAC